MTKASSPPLRRPRKPDHSRTWLKRLVNRAEKDPSVLKRGRCQDPELCEALCERATHLALVEAPAALPLAQATAELAERLDETHLRNRSREVLVHAYAAADEWDRAMNLLNESIREAVDCCGLCRAAYFNRLADLCNRSGDPAGGFVSLGIALAHNEKDFDTHGWSKENFDSLGRIMHVHAVNWASVGLRPMALAFAEIAFLAISLDSPRGFFLELLALVSDVLRGGKAYDDELAQHGLEYFRGRIKGTEMADVLARLTHVEGLVYARLGGKSNFRAARDRLDGAAAKLVNHGAPIDALAGALDAAQFRCRAHPNAKYDDLHFPSGNNLRIAKRLLQKCAERSDLGPGHQKGIAALLNVFKHRPEDAFANIGAFRETLDAPVAALLGDRIGPPPETDEEPASGAAAQAGEAPAEAAPAEPGSAVSWSLPASGVSGDLRYSSSPENEPVELCPEEE